MPQPTLNDLVVTVIDLHHPTGKCIPAYTVGVICGKASNGLVQVKFGRYGVKYLSPSFIEIVGFLDRSEPSAVVGQDLLALVAHLNDQVRSLKAEVRRLRGQLSERLKRAPSRLISANNDGARATAPRREDPQD